MNPRTHSTYPRLIALILSSTLTACTTVNFRQGYLLRNAKSVSYAGDSFELPRAYGANDVLQFQNPPITIRLGQAAKDSVISAGPLVAVIRSCVIAFPVIPWPPGIVKAFRPPSDWKTSPDKVHVIVTFISNKPYPYGYPIKENPEKLKFPFELEKISPFGFDPMNVRIKTKDNTYSPSSFATKGYMGGDVSKQLVNNMTTQPLTFEVGESVRDGVSFDIAFDIPYSVIQSATLDIGEVRTRNGPVRLPQSEIRKNKKFKLWVMAGV